MKLYELITSKEEAIILQIIFECEYDEMININELFKEVNANEIDEKTRIITWLNKMEYKGIIDSFTENCATYYSKNTNTPMGILIDALLKIL